MERDRSGVVENTVPFDIWKFRKVEPEFLVEWNAPWIAYANEANFVNKDSPIVGFAKSMSTIHTVVLLTDIWSAFSTDGAICRLQVAGQI